MKNQLSCLILLLLANALFAQKISVGKVDEARSTGDSYFGNRLEVELRISGEEVRKYKYVKVSGLTKATDDQGIDLIDEDELRFDYDEIEENFVNLTIRMNNTSRKATVIKDMAGEITLFNPTEANGAVLKVANFQSKPNTNLLPAKAPLKIVYLDKKAYEEFHKANKDKTEAELKKLPEASRQVAKMLLEAFEGFAYMGEDENQLTFLLDGDVEKLVDVKFEDENGKARNQWCNQKNSLRFKGY
ncbi:MAG: hypothetical protein IPJ74_08710 [Saprospiraceae bacterium]|nr:hypothetical protein [Saprospiraceae bacterium]